MDSPSLCVMNTSSAIPVDSTCDASGGFTQLVELLSIMQGLFDFCSAASAVEQQLFFGRRCEGFLVTGGVDLLPAGGGFLLVRRLFGFLVFLQPVARFFAGGSSMSTGISKDRLLLLLT